MTDIQKAPANSSNQVVIPPQDPPIKESQSPWYAPLRTPAKAVGNFLSRELVLGPKDHSIPAEGHQEADVTVARDLPSTIKEGFKVLWRHAPSSLLARGAIAATGAGLPLAWAWFSGKLVGSITDPVNAGLTVTFALGAAASYSLVQDVIGRTTGLFYSWEGRKSFRLTAKLASTVTSSWTYEELEDGKKQLSYDRFFPNANKLYELVRNSLEGFGSAATATTAALLMLPLDWRLSAVSLAFVGLRSYRDIKEARVSFALEKRSASERRSLGVKEDLSSRPRSIRDVRFLGKDAVLQAEFQEGSEEIDKRELRNDFRVQAIKLCYDLVPAGLIVGALATVARRFGEGMIDTQGVVAYVGYAFNMAGAIRSVGFAAGQIVNLQTFASEALDFLGSKRLPHPSALSLPEAYSPPTIRMENVGVDRGGKRILTVPGLCIEPGEIIGIVGREGAGKSTLVKTILGLRTPDVGAVTLHYGSDTFDLSKVNLAEWHKRVGLYNQDFSPPEGLSIGAIVDLGANRGLGTGELTRAGAIQLSGAKFVDSLKNGTDAVMGPGWPKGVDPSGGERKQIGMAVALRSNSPVLILDEPTANISRESGATILNEICTQARRDGRTVIIVSHNFENFSFVDRILGVDGGRIVQDGPPARLRNLPGPYRDGLFTSVRQNLSLLDLELRTTEEGEWVVERSEVPTEGVDDRDEVEIAKG